MEHTEHTITVEAPQSVVWDVLADVENYSNLFTVTQSSTIVEEAPGYQIARLVVDVSGEIQSWTTRRDLDHELGTISFQQLQTASLVEHMGGEWRAFAFGPERTQLVVTHDFAARQEGEDGKVAGKYTHQEAHEMVAGAVERNSVSHLAVMRDEAERRAAEVVGTAS